MDNKAYMRTLEAFLSAIIMIMAISFMMSEEQISYTAAPSSEVVEGKNYVYDVLAVIENSKIHGQGKLSYYIAHRDTSSLQRDIEGYIEKEYTYQMEVYKMRSIVVDTSSIAVTDPATGDLTNGYTITSDMNYNDIWHYYEGGLFDLPITVRMLVTDHNDEPGYDTLYLNFDHDDSNFTNMDTWEHGDYSWELYSMRELQVGDAFLIKKEVTDEYTLLYKYTVNRIAPDGKSVAFSLEKVDMTLYTLPYEIDIFDWTTRFSYTDGTLTVELNESGEYRTLAQNLEKGDFVEINRYIGYINSLSSAYLSVDFHGYKHQIMGMGRGGKVHTAVSARRIINVREGDDLDIYYVYLVRGRGESE